MRHPESFGRVVHWFSCGAASAVAGKLARAEYPGRVVHVYTDPGSEHSDSKRFLADVERWYDAPVIVLKSEKYSDTWQVWNERRFIVGPKGALCTTELKKMPRFKFQKADDLQVFGYTAEEQDRADQFRRLNFEVMLDTPLIRHGLTKDDCLAMVERARIELPVMYRLGFKNNNCIGCPKGGMGYWNRIRRHFPETFARMAVLERDIGASCLRSNGESVWLDELEPTRGDMASEPNIECSLLCAMAEDHIDHAAIEQGERE